MRVQGTPSPTVPGLRTLQTSPLAPGLFKGETAFTQVSPQLASPGKVASHSHGGELTLQWWSALD